MSNINLVEETNGIGKPRLDKERGIVHGVKIIGLRSKQGYDYLPSALKEAIPLYEGKKVNIDHPPRETPGMSRSYADRFGRFHNVNFREGSGLHGELHYNKKHRLAEQFEYDVEHDPSQLGMSHNARGNSKERGGRVFVESIDLVRSVDLVADPATTNSLFESEGGRMITTKRKKVMVRRRNAAAKSKIKGLLAQLMEDDAEVPSPAPAGGGGGGDVNSMIMNGVEKILSANGDPTATAKKIAMLVKKLLQVKVDIDDAMAPEAEADPAADVPESQGSKKKRSKKDLTEADPEDDEDDDDEEGDGLNNRIAKLERQLAVRDMCESMGFRPTKTQTKALLRLDNDTELKEMIESLGGTEGKPGRFRSASKPTSRADASATREYKSAKDWIESLNDDEDGE